MTQVELLEGLVKALDKGLAEPLLMAATKAELALAIMNGKEYGGAENLRVIGLLREAIGELGG